ncbi:MAG TPA: hypothetical protein VMS43_12965 [Allosphingosinicella sp.]|nr:hypothetical protein [Allosphingosinicella sp.]
MHIVDTTKFVIGIAFFLIGLVMLVRAKGTRGFNQSRQAGAILLVGAAIFVAIGFGLDFKSLFQ